MVRIDRKLHPGAERLQLEAEDYVSGENAIQLPFASESQDVKAFKEFGSSEELVGKRSRA